MSSIPIGDNFIFEDISMVILYKNDRNVRFVLFTKTSIGQLSGFMLSPKPRQEASNFDIKNKIRGISLLSSGNKNFTLYHESTHKSLMHQRFFICF